MSSVAWIVMMVTISKVVYTLSSWSVCLSVSLIRQEPNLCLCAHVCKAWQISFFIIFPFFAPDRFYVDRVKCGSVSEAVCGVCALIWSILFPRVFKWLLITVPCPLQQALPISRSAWNYWTGAFLLNCVAPPLASNNVIFLLLLKGFLVFSLRKIKVYVTFMKIVFPWHMLLNRKSCLPKVQLRPNTL